ncbi:MAG: Bug family tripartite tricarboxylate transporter substrate binding protein [Burkholderiales bacterium]
MTGLRRILVGVLATASASIALAQSYPSKPVRFIVPFPPGGSADILARTIGQKMSEGLGQSIVIDNRPGAGTAIGAEATAKSAADGYTIMIGTVSSHAINPSLNAKLAYDPIRDFTPISPVASIPFALLVHPSLPAKNIEELIAVARAKPGVLNFSSAGNGTSNHLAGELFKSMARIDLVHIPYKGSAPALNDLLAGQVNMMFDLVLTAAPHVKAGTVRAIAVTGKERSGVLPTVRTIAESGLPEYEVSAWFGIFAPANLPAPVVQSLNKEVVRIMQLADVRERLASQGAEPMSGSSAAFTEFVRGELAKWSGVVKAAGMRSE